MKGFTSGRAFFSKANLELLPSVWTVILWDQDSETMEAVCRQGGSAMFAISHAGDIEGERLQDLYEDWYVIQFISRADAKAIIGADE